MGRKHIVDLISRSDDALATGGCRAARQPADNVASFFIVECLLTPCVVRCIVVDCTRHKWTHYCRRRMTVVAELHLRRVIRNDVNC